MPLEIAPTQEDLNALPPSLRDRIVMFLDYIATVEMCAELGIPYCLNLRRRIAIRHGELQSALAALNLDWTNPIRAHLRRIHLHFHRRMERFRNTGSIRIEIVEEDGEEEE